MAWGRGKKSSNPKRATDEEEPTTPETGKEKAVHYFWDRDRDDDALWRARNNISLSAAQRESKRLEAIENAIAKQRAARLARGCRSRSAKRGVMGNG